MTFKSPGTTAKMESSAEHPKSLSAQPFRHLGYIPFEDSQKYFRHSTISSGRRQGHACPEIFSTDCNHREHSDGHRSSENLECTKAILTPGVWGMDSLDLGL